MMSLEKLFALDLNICIILIHFISFVLLLCSEELCEHYFIKGRTYIKECTQMSPVCSFPKNICLYESMEINSKIDIGIKRLMTTYSVIRNISAKSV